MNKAELSAEIAERLSVTKKQSEDFIEVFTAIVTEELSRQDEVTIAGFGSFSSRIRAARMGVNPQKPTERIHVPEVLVPKFKAGKALKDTLKASQRGGVSADNSPTEPEVSKTEESVEEDSQNNVGGLEY